jgi:uncharacterized membrane protein YcaP (DUF421 family)
MLVVTLIMGKRSIAELPVFDFLVIVILGAVVGADIADPKIKHIHTAVAIVLIGAFHVIVSKLKVRYKKFGHVITFEPTIVIQNGKFIVKNLSKIRYAIDNVLQMLREKDVFDVNDVEIGIVEPNGNISVLKKPNRTEVTIGDLNLKKSAPPLSYPVIIEGVVYKDIVLKLGLTEEWLNNQLINMGIKSPEEVFFASVNTNNELHVSLKSFMENEDHTLPIYH